MPRDWSFRFCPVPVSYTHLDVYKRQVLIIFLHDKKDHVEQAVKLENYPKENPISGAFKGLGMLFTNIAFWIILLYFATPSLPGWATKNWLPTLFAENLSLDMSEAGPLSTFTIAISSFIGVIAGGILSDKWIQRNVRGLSLIHI